MKKSNIVLIGFMGSGKSLVARTLHEKLGWPMFSTDNLIEEREKRSISEIFEKSGEAYFRRLEHEIVKGLSQKQNVIIDCGGGVVLNSDNIKLLKEKGVIFYLKASPEVIYERIKNEKHRPLLGAKDPLESIRNLINQRQPLYEQADYVVDANDKSVLVLVEKILKRMNDSHE